MAQLPIKPDQGKLHKLEDWKENQNQVFNCAKTKNKTKLISQNYPAGLTTKNLQYFSHLLQFNVVKSP